MGPIFLGGGVICIFVHSCFDFFNDVDICLCAATLDFTMCFLKISFDKPL